MVRHPWRLLPALALALLARPAAGQTGAPVSAPAPVPWANKLFLERIERDPARQAPAVVAHDFGTVPQGTVCSRALRMTNVYDVPIQILEVRSSCSCLEATLPRKTLLPNETAAITVTLDTARFAGPVSHTLFVTVGPLHVSTAALKFTAVSRPDVAIRPGRADFGTVEPGDAPKVRLTLEYHGDRKEWRPAELLPPEGPFLVELRADPNAPADAPRYFLDVQLDPSAPAGPFGGVLLVRTSDDGAAPLRIPVSGAVRSPLEVSRESVEFGAVKVGETVSHRVIVRSPGGLFRLEAEADPAGDADADLSVELFPAAAPVQIVTIRYTPSRAGGMARDVKLRCSRGGAATVRVSAEAGE